MQPRVATKFGYKGRGQYLLCMSPDIIDWRSEIMWPVSESTVEAILHTMPSSIGLMDTCARLVIA